jgi:hypothetical protein
MAADEQLAFVGSIKAHEKIAERCLAGSVLAEQRVNLSLSRLERDTIIGDDRREALCHLDGLERQHARSVACVIGWKPRRRGGTCDECRLFPPGVQNRAGH